MARYTITRPDGSEVTVDAIDPMDAYNKANSQSVSTPGKGVGMATAIGQGIGTGLEGLASMPSQIASLAVSQAAKGAGMLGASPSTQSDILKARDYIPLASPQSVVNVGQKLTGFVPMSDQQVQDLPQGEKYAYRAAEFVPGAVAFGVRNLLKAPIADTAKEAIKSGVKYGAIPGATGEFAVQAANSEGTPSEWWIRTLGALAGGGAASTASNAAKWGLMAKEPNVAGIFGRAKTLKTAADRFYTQMDNSGIQIDPVSLKSIVARIESTLTGGGTIRVQDLPPVTQKALAALEARSNEPMSFRSLDLMRQYLRDAVDSGQAKVTGRYAGQMVKALDDYINGLTSADVSVAGNMTPQATASALGRARDLWSKGAAFENKAKIVSDIWEAARDQNAANYTKAGMQTALRRGFKSLKARMRNDPELRHSFTAVERQEIDKIVNGASPAENILRRMGKWAPTSPASAGFSAAGGLPLAGAALAATGDPAVAGAVGAIPSAAGLFFGVPARLSSNIMQRQQVNRLVDTILNNGNQLPAAAGSAFRPAVPLSYGFASRATPTVADLQAALALPPTQGPR